MRNIPPLERRTSVKAVALTTCLLAAAITATAGSSFAQSPTPAYDVLLPGESDTIPDELNVLNNLPSARPFQLESNDASPSDTTQGIENPPFELPAMGPPAPTASSGTWLRRGLWYFESDLVMLQRTIFRNVDLATSGSQPQFILIGQAPQVEANMRLTLGRLISRDIENRDQMFEVTYYGLGEWDSQDTLIASRSLDNILDGNALTLSFDYSSSLDSIEINYVSRTRLGRDRMALDPDGQWVREATPGHIYSIIGGTRLVVVDERFRFSTTGFFPVLREDSLEIETSNVLLGMQAGLSFLQQHSRWNYGVIGKAGPYINFAQFDSQLDSDVLGNVTKKTHKQTIAFVGELGVFANYQIRPNVSFRVAYEALWTGSVAVAPVQITSNAPGLAELSTSRTAMYQGFSVGLEAMW